jgi:hypothetical protein
LIKNSWLDAFAPDENDLLCMTSCLPNRERHAILIWAKVFQVIEFVGDIEKTNDINHLLTVTAISLKMSP